MDNYCVGSAGTKYSSCIYRGGTVPHHPQWQTRSFKALWMTMPGLLTRFISNANTNSQLETLKFNYQGQQDLGEGLNLRTRTEKALYSVASCPALRKWTQAKYYLCILRSQSFHCIRLGQPSNQIQACSMRDILLGTALGPQFRGPALPPPCVLGSSWVLSHRWPTF